MHDFANLRAERDTRRAKNKRPSQLETADVQMAHGSGSRLGSGMMSGGGEGGAAKDEAALAKPTQSGQGLATEVSEGQITQLAKNILFGVEGAQVAKG